MDSAPVGMWISMLLGIFVPMSAGMAGAEGIALALARSLGKERPSARVFFFTHLLLVDALAVAVSFILVPAQSWPLWWILWTLPLIVIGRAVWANAVSKADTRRELIGRYLNAYGLALGYLLVLTFFLVDRFFHV